MPSFLDKPEIAEFCRQRQVARLSLFGSYLHGEAGNDSDVDLLVEFLPNARVGLFEMVDFENELSDLLGIKVDLVEPRLLKWVIRDRVLQEAQVVFAA